MPNCFSCNNEFKVGDAFCSNCGRKFKPSSKAQYSEPVKPLYPHRDLKTALVTEDKKRARYALIMLAIIAPFTLCYIAVGFFSNAWGGAGILSVINTAVPLYILFRNRRYSEYKSLPGAEVYGKHHCIYCGHKGVYKKGEYKSNAVTASCTSCESFLYVTSK